MLTDPLPPLPVTANAPFINMDAEQATDAVSEAGHSSTRLAKAVAKPMKIIKINKATKQVPTQLHI